MTQKRLPILDIWVDPIGMAEVLERVSLFVEQGERAHVIYASNPEKNFSVPKNPHLYRCFQDADLLIPDGVGMVVAARILYGVNIERVTGCDLMQNICVLAAAKGYKIFLYGAKEEVSKQAAEMIRERYPGIQIAGRADGYIPPGQMDELVASINESGAQILFVALGSPAQENWVASYKNRLAHVRLCQGIGGTLDVVAGTVKRAPDLFRRLGLEWLYRLIEDPSRWHRQRILPIFVWRVVWAKIKSLSAGGRKRV